MAGTRCGRTIRRTGWASRIRIARWRAGSGRPASTAVTTARPEASPAMPGPIAARDLTVASREVTNREAMRAAPGPTRRRDPTEAASREVMQGTHVRMRRRERAEAISVGLRRTGRLRAATRIRAIIPLPGRVGTRSRSIIQLPKRSGPVVGIRPAVTVAEGTATPADRTSGRTAGLAGCLLVPVSRAFRTTGGKTACPTEARGCRFL
jgi:hypothetical protein